MAQSQRGEELSLYVGVILVRIVYSGVNIVESCSGSSLKV